MKNKTRKDKRKPLTGAKSISNRCRNNGTCSACISNRTIKNKKRADTIKEALKLHRDENR